MKDANGNIVGHLSVSLITSTESVPQPSSEEHHHSETTEGTLVFTADGGAFAVASVMLGIVPAEGEETALHEVAVLATSR